MIRKFAGVAGLMELLAFFGIENFDLRRLKRRKHPTSRYYIRDRFRLKRQKLTRRFMRRYQRAWVIVNQDLARRRKAA